MTMFPHSRTHRMHHCEDAKFLTHTLGGIWRNDRGNAPCPVCQPERRRGQNALSISGTGGKLLLHCFKNGCSFAHITRAAGIVLGVVAIDRDGQKKSDNMRGRYNAKQATKAQADKRAAQAQRIWRESEPIVGTLAERYLRSRGIFRFFPDTLRFHPACWHATGKRIPTMVALVEGSEEFALHLTYLQSDGMGKTKAYPAKAMLGRCAGGVMSVETVPEGLRLQKAVRVFIEQCTDDPIMCGKLDASGSQTFEYLGRDLSRDEAKQIAASASGFFSVLAEWSRAEMSKRANDNGDPSTSADEGVAK